MELILQREPDNDACYIAFGQEAFTPGGVAESRRVNEDIALDFDNEGRLLGIDVMNASRRLSGDLESLVTDSLVGTKEAAAMAGVRPSNFVRDYANREDFPKPVTELATGRIWRRGDLLRYLQNRRSTTIRHTA
jgi:uncharacterized protein YuzE